MQGKLQEATVEFEKLHEELGDPLKGVAALAFVYAKQGRRDEAIDHFAELAERFPRSRYGLRARRVLAELAKKTSR